MPRQTLSLQSTFAMLFLVWALLTTAHAQLTPSGDSYTNSADKTTNYGAATLLDVDGASQITYIQFNLASIPPGSSITQATLKLYVNSVTTAGSFNVDYANGAWSEGTIDWSNAPSLGTTIAASVPVVTADKNQYLLINVTSALQAWLNGSETNNGIALVANGSTNLTFDSKENTTTSHPAELDVVFTSGEGTITGVSTASGSGLQGGGTSGTLNLSLINTCASGQVLSWNGSAWVCTTVKGTGTVTSVGSGLGLVGGPITTSGTLSVDTTAVPLLASANTFTNGQVINSTGNVDGLDASSSGGTGILGIATSGDGVGGVSASATGVIGITGNDEAYGVAGIDGSSTGDGTGVYGSSPGGHGVYGTGGALGTGVYGTGLLGVAAYGANTAIYAEATGPGGAEAAWILGYSAPYGSGYDGTNGVEAEGGTADTTVNYSDGGFGIMAFAGGGGDYGGAGGAFSGGYGAYGGDGVDASGNSGTSANGYAGYFTGDLAVTGAITAGTEDFKIDHPLDPANKYLVHASVESSEMMNIYTGNVTTDAQGVATVSLPDWFEVLNTDFRYQLTVIGQFAQAIVAREIQNHQFEIRTSAPNVKVSWQVTGVRQDAYAKAHPLVVEEEKEARLKGFYIHPDLYGAPEEKQIQWARYPKMMKRMKEHREAPRPSTAPIALPVPRPAPTLPAAMQRALTNKK